MTCKFARMIAVAAAAMSANSVDAQPTEQTAENGSADITVIGRMQEQKEAVRTLARDITRPQRNGSPLAKYYEPMCFATFGLSSDYGSYLIELMQDNARNLGLRIAEPGCQANALVAIQSDAKGSFDQLKTEYPWVFGQLNDYEIDRIEKGDEAVRAWNVLEDKGLDGTPFFTTEIDGIIVPINVDKGNSRLKQPIRRDMVISVVMIDADEIVGKSLQQIADYSSVRLLTQTYDETESDVSISPTILSLFTDPDNAPPSMTRFDRAYIRALYKLPAYARSTQIVDATATAFENEADAAPLARP